MPVGDSPAVATPSMSFALSPQSASALRAASAWRPIWERSGMSPSSVVSAAPTMATLFCFTLRSHRPEPGQADLSRCLFECHFELEVQRQGFRSLVDANDVGHHPRSLSQLDDGDGVWRLGLEARRGPVVDDVGVQLPAATGGEACDVAGLAGRAERAWRKVDVAAGRAALEPQLARP